MAVALTLLTAMQVYLLSGAYIGENERFEQSVKEALINVKYRVERNHIEQQLNKRINMDALQRDIINSLDSIQSGFNAPRDESPFWPDSALVNAPGLYDDLQGNTSETPGISQETPGRIIERFDGNVEMLEQNPDQLKSIFKDLLFGYLSYNNRDLNIGLIDTALREELALRGINTQFEFGIYNSFNNSFRYAQTTNSSVYIYSGYQIPLYYIGLRNAIMLSVNFPNKTQYILYNIFFLLVSTFFVILVIVGLFVYSIRIIYKQRRLSEMKNDLINNITHELKTPISIISLACQALDDEDMAKIEGIRNNYLNVIAQENKRLGSLVENILQSAVLEKGDLKLNFETISVHDVIETAVESLSMRMEKQKVNLVLELNAASPYIMADETHFTNMVFNLIDNAIKYSKPNHPNPLLHISTSLKDNYFYLTVEDDGIGISKDDQKKIFDKLYRVSTGNVHNVKGYGLGLNYVKSIVTHHKGEITVKSDLGKGTRFIVKIPVQQ